MGPGAGSKEHTPTWGGVELRLLHRTRGSRAVVSMRTWKKALRYYVKLLSYVTKLSYVTLLSYVTKLS